MNSAFLIEKLENSEEFKKFVDENKDAYLCSGFFILDLNEENQQNKYHFDFYVPSTKESFSFELEEGVKLVKLERFSEIILEKISMKKDFDFDLIKNQILSEMELNHINNKLQKIIFSLQCKDGRDILIGTIFVSGLGMISANYDIPDSRFTSFEKKSLFDMMKIVKK